LVESLQDRIEQLEQVVEGLRERVTQLEVLAPGRTDLRFANREWDQLFECDAGMKKAGGFLHRLASFQVLD